MNEKKIERRALQLQARGPDEFPFGYYLYLARKEFEENKEGKRGGKPER